MKRIRLTSIILIAALLTSCGTFSNPEKDPPIVRHNETAESEKADEVSDPTSTPVPTQKPTTTPTATPTPTPTPTVEPVHLPDDLDMIPGFTDEELYGDTEFLEVDFHTDYYLGFGKDIPDGIRSWYGCRFYASEETANAYPELVKVLTYDDADLIIDSVSIFPTEDRPRSGFYIKRADSKVFSMLTYYCSPTSDSAIMSVIGYNLDPSTGEVIMPEDIFTDLDAVAVKLGFNDFSELQDEHFVYVIEPYGVEFVFDEMEYKEILYRGNEDLFVLGDMFGLDSFVMSLGDLYDGRTVTIDLDNDGVEDTLSIDGYNSLKGFWVNVNDVKCNGEADYEGHIAGNHYLIHKDGKYYLVCSIIGDNVWTESLVYEITADSVEFIGNVYGAFSGVPITIDKEPDDNIFPFDRQLTDTFPSDPDRLFTKGYVHGLSTYEAYFPISTEDFRKQPDGYGISAANNLLTTKCDIEAEDYETNEPKGLLEGTMLRITLIDRDPEDMKVVVQDINTGELYLLHLDDAFNMNGTKVEDFFSGVFFAG